MLTCRDVTEQTTDYLERSLGLRQRLAMRLHLGLCVSCRTHLDQLRKTILLLRNRPLGAPSAGVAESIAAQATRRDSRRPTDSQS